MTLDIIRLEIS